jgi:retron-type reverse transcriptase
MRYSDLISKSNLNVAWRRITTANNVRYKNYFRHILEAYELSYKENLEDLFQRLKNNVYKPEDVIRIYYPKASGLMRPITLLCLEDQIIYQAIANFFADKVRNRREKLQGKIIFSNWLTHKRNSEFFLFDWKHGYFGMRKKIIDEFNQGNKWMVTFDLSAFYDTISHDLLMKIIAPRSKTSEFSEFITKALLQWSSDKPSIKHNHGIPQGPIASNFLSECFMLPIDEKMSKQYTYIRYVDDIRIMGKTEKEVRKSLVDLDILCRERGLIPNSEKTSILRLSSEEDVMQNIPPVLLYEESDIDVINVISDKLILEVVKEEKGNLVVKDKSRFRYILFHSGPSNLILTYIINLWHHYPEHIDAFSSFLENYDKVSEIINICLQDIESNPYDFVKGEAWKILARMLDKDEHHELISLAINERKSKNENNPATRIGLYIFLFSCEELGLGKLSNFLLYESALIQAISAKYIKISFGQKQELVSFLLKRHLPDVSLALAHQLFEENISLDKLGYDINNLPMITQNVYNMMGIINTGQRTPDYELGYKLAKLYKITKWDKWHILLGSEYFHAYNIFNTAEKYFDTFKSEWLEYQDSFNDALIRALNNFLISKNSPGGIETKHKKGLKDYGEILNDKNFSSIYPDLTQHLLVVHKRRNELPGAHPYEKYTGRKAQPLKYNEQKKLVEHLKAAYQEIIKIATNLGV